MSMPLFGWSPVHQQTLFAITSEYKLSYSDITPAEKRQYASPISRSPVGPVGQFRPGSRGGWLPRASSARAMRGWGPWNPNAIRVSSRILVFVDSIRLWERPWSRLASIA